jgi:hypothetical protein
VWGAIDCYSATAGRSHPSSLSSPWNHPAMPPTPRREQDKSGRLGGDAGEAHYNSIAHPLLQVSVPSVTNPGSLGRADALEGQEAQTLTHRTPRPMTECKEPHIVTLPHLATHRHGRRVFPSSWPKIRYPIFPYIIPRYEHTHHYAQLLVPSTRHASQAGR